VLAIAGGSAKAAFCRDLGADPVIDHHSENVAEAVLEATGGVGAHVIYDPVGGDAFHAATRCIAHEGRLLLVGFASGRWGTPDAAHMATRNYSVLGVIPGGYDRAFKEGTQEYLLSQYRAGTIRVPVHRSLSFRQLPRGLEDLANGVAMGKIVLRN
jgi:NADPH2:quinone reductase